MKLTLLCCAAAILVTYVAGQQACDDTQPKCSSCENYGPQCEDCPKMTILSQNRESCLSCDTGCMKCTSDAQDVITCTECGTGYYLKNGACVECGAGCDECEEVNSVVTCKACQKEAYVQDLVTAGTPCIACPSNCKTCTLTDGATTCTDCYNSLGVRGYYVKDGSCKTCPTNCEKCRDDDGTVRCDTCIGTYMKFDDTSDDTKDNTKCLICPSECKACSGEVLSGSSTKAKCTDCVADKGVELLNDECSECTTNCKNCDSENAGQCLECNEAYRVDNGACTACPDNCKACSQDADTGDVSCDTCDSTWGEKTTTSITCDKCTKSNCKTCALDGTCSICKAGYYLDSASGDCKTCSSNTANCALCVNADGTCTECASGYYKLSADDSCTAMPSNCITGDAANADQCTACETGYGLEGGTTCTQCTGNCDACDSTADQCDTASCSEGYSVAADGTCVECTVDNCDKCGDGSAPTTTCTACKPGYIVDSNACQACPANCASGQCTFDSTAGATVGTCAQCVQYAAASGDTPAVQGYVMNDNKCYRCPTGCIDATCTYNADASKTECTTCATGYIENADTKLCDKCETENCLDCELDSESGSVVCVADQCESGYGQKADKLCYACPAFCSTCSVPAEATDDVLICDTCEDAYVKNDKVCAKCPTNCNTCANEQGTMTCSACKDGYALDSNKACVKCPSNCDECTATGSIRCKTCATGYSLSEARDSCVACATAAFDNCAECTNTVNGTANCTECATGYTLKDEVEQRGECVSTSGLSCGLGDMVDEPLECLTCESGWNLVDRKCARMCYACGDLTNGVGVDPPECPTGGNMTGSADPKLIPCFGLACACVRDSDGKVACGCNTPEYSCDATDVEKGETCRTANGKEECARCCTEDKCNTFASALDGVVDLNGASLTGASLMLVVAAALLAHF